jgi:hypothetical protein
LSEEFRTPRIATASMSATAPISSKASMNRTVRRRDDSRRSDKIMTAQPRLIASHATSSAAPFSRPQTPSAPIRLTAAPKSHPLRPCDEGDPNAQAKAAGARQNPNNQRASGSRRKATASPASRTGSNDRVGWIGKPNHRADDSANGPEGEERPTRARRRKTEPHL